MALSKIRVGLVGAGFAAQFHAQCLRRVYGLEVELVGVTSLRRESREKFAVQHDIRAYENLEGMLADVDLVDFCSPPYAHEEGILTACDAGTALICEKPLTGYVGPEGCDDAFHGDRTSKQMMLEEALVRLGRIADTVSQSQVFFGYAENFVYAPSVQKEQEILEKTGSQILRMTGEESHNGSASDTYGFWRLAGGGSLIGKGCHPLSGMLYLKRIERIARNGCPIRPATVSARTHQITRAMNFVDAGFIRTDYHAIEDYGIMHVTFQDGTIADAISCELVLGGIYDYIEVFANNHRTRCHISPAGLTETYNPRAEQFDKVYLIEKLSSQEGWVPASPDEHFTMGYQAELQDFLWCAAHAQAPQSGIELALDTTVAIYAAYVSDENRGAEVEIKTL